IVMWGSEGDCTIEKSGYVKQIATELRTADFDYPLPPDHVAAAPAHVRDESRLFVMPRGGGSPNKHGHFRELAAHLPERSLLVLNDTRVLAARLRARKPTGGVVELLLTRAISAAPASGLSREASAGGPGASFCEIWEALGRGLGNAPLGLQLEIVGTADAPSVVATLVERGEEGRFVIRVEGRGAPSLAAALDALGEVPLPPYIVAARRAASEAAP